MRIPRYTLLALHLRIPTFRADILLVTAALLLVAPLSTRAAITWDAEAGTHWWFNPVNWNTNSNINTVLPPDNGTQGVTDAQINLATGAWDQGQGVVYDPANDPHFNAAALLPRPAGYGPQSIAQLYMSRNTTIPTLLTIKGDIEAHGGGSLGWTIGRSSGTAGVGTSARVNQISGKVQITDRSLDLGTTDTSNPGYGSGTWDYRGGILDVSRDAGQGLRLSTGGSAGTGGVGHFIMHNPGPDSPGYVRPYSMNVAAHALTANGTTNGVGIVEFHYENGGTRPIQVVENLTINNGDESGGQVRSSRLDLVLNQAPCAGAECIPQDIGLFDVDFFDPAQLLDPVGVINGSGTNPGLFSNADGSIVYTPGSTVSANFGSTQYNWTISYTGEITWVGDGSTGVVASVSGSGGKDIVLIGHSSIPGMGVEGDFNGDGKVEAADYVYLRKNGGDYATWRMNFGAMAGGGASAGLAVGAVPEPAGLVLLVLGAVGCGMARRRR